MALLVPAAVGQVVLSPSPSRVLGHPQAALRTINPNYVEGQELYEPYAVAVDARAVPPILYVADTRNSRVLAWRNASQFGNGATADMVIGQRDLFTTNPQGPGAEFTSGLAFPTGLAVNAQGDLFVSDAGNHRVLRYPKPFDNPQPALPDLVIGQQSLTTRTSNNDPDTRTISNRTLLLAAGSSFYVVPLFIDPDGNLFVGDAGNHRVLRYPANKVGQGAANMPEADLVIGQPSFTQLPPRNPANTADLGSMAAASCLGMDPSRRLYVCDSYQRVLVYPASMFSGAAAEKKLGGVGNAQGGLQPPTAQSLYEPNGIFFAGDRPYVLDSRNHRILRFKRFEEWPSDGTAPSADDLIGQLNYTEYRPNRDASWPVTTLNQRSAVSFNYPASAVLAGNELLLADTRNNRVIVMPDVGTKAGSDVFASRVLGQGYLDDDGPNRVSTRGFYFGGFAAGIAVDTRSNPPRLYVADSVNNRILGFPDARTVKLGDPATLIIGQESDHRSAANYQPGNPGQPSQHGLANPQGLAVDSEGNLWVADSANGRVLRFREPFKPENMPGPGEMFAADLVLGKRSFTATPGSAPDPSIENFGYPLGLAFTTAGHLLVSDAAFHRALLFVRPEGGFSSAMSAAKVFGQSTFEARVAATSDTDRQHFNTPLHIAVDPGDRLFVCDYGLHRVLIFDSITERSSGAAADTSITALGGGMGSLRSPRGIFSSPATGDTWIATNTTGRNYGLLRVRGAFTAPDFFVGSGTVEVPLGVTATGSGTPLVAVSTHRILAYSPATTITNAANYEPELSPGMYATLWPFTGYAFPVATTTAPQIPLPTDLSDVQLLINGQPAPLHFVSPGQINFLAPMSMPTSGTLQVQLVRKSTGEALAVGCAQNSTRTACLDPYLALQASSYSVGLFTADNSGRFQIRAVNVRADGTYYGINSLDNPVKGGDFLELYLTGQGLDAGTYPDGDAPGPGHTTARLPQVFLGPQLKQLPDSDIPFSGLNPLYPGLWQVNIRIPTGDGAPIGPQVPVRVIYRSSDSWRGGKFVQTIAVSQ